MRTLSFYVLRMVLLVVSLIIVFPLALSDDTGSKKIQIVRLLAYFGRKNSDIYIFTCSFFLPNPDKFSCNLVSKSGLLGGKKTVPIHIFC